MELLDDGALGDAVPLWRTVRNGLEDGIELALRALASVGDDGLNPAGLGVATVAVDTAQYRGLDREEIREHIVANELLAEGEDGDGLSR